MFSQLLAFFSLKRKFCSIEGTNTSIDENNGRPTKRVRIEELSSNQEDSMPQNSPVQAACITNDELDEKEVLDEVLPRGVKGKGVERVEESEKTWAIAAHLREETPNRVEPVDHLAKVNTTGSSRGQQRVREDVGDAADPLKDAQLEHRLWQAAMAEVREEGRRQKMQEVRREQGRRNEERRSPPSTSFARPSSSSTPLTLAPTFGIPHPPLARPSTPLELDEWVFGFGPEALLPQPSVPIFIQLPAQTGPSPNPPCRHPPTLPRYSPTSVDESSSETILASLRHLRQQFSKPCSHHCEGDNGEITEDDDDDGSEDEDLPLFTAMMQGSHPSSNPESHREYPVYAEDLDLPDDQPQVTQEDTQVITYLSEDSESFWSLARHVRGPSVSVEEDEESPEERLQRLVREGEAEDLE